MPRILKDEVKGKGGFEMSVYRWKPDTSDLKGGIEIFLRSVDLESYFKALSGEAPTVPVAGNYPDVISGPHVYAVSQRRFLSGLGSAGANGMFQLDAVYWQPHLRADSRLIRRDGDYQFPVWPLMAVGLGNGAKYRLEGIYPLEEIKKWGELIRHIVNDIYRAYFKPLQLEVDIERVA